jgi:peptidoglycan/xylan/chitin deacetylase (PgdA/CDA1 family)
LSENYKIVSAEEVYEGARKNEENKLCAITFDDGLKDQYINAVPILKKYNATATFFPITATFDGKYIPPAHKVHLLLSHFDIKELIEKFNNFFPGNTIPTDGSRINKIRRLFEEPDAANFKEALLNTPIAGQSSFLDSIEIPSDPSADGGLFMSAEDIANLKSQGFSIGCHSHKHYAYVGGNEGDIVQDIKSAKLILSDILGNPPVIFSFPNGRYNESLMEVLKDEGFKYAFSIEAREVAKGDAPFLIPRFDTNDIKKIIK